MKAWLSHLWRAMKAGSGDIGVMLSVVTLIYGFSYFFGLAGVTCIVGYFLFAILRNNWDYTR